MWFSSNSELSLFHGSDPSALLSSPEGQQQQQPPPPAPPPQERPALRRERTFDLEPGTSIQDTAAARVVEISLESPTPPTDARQYQGRRKSNGGVVDQRKERRPPLPPPLSSPVVRLSREQERLLKEFRKRQRRSLDAIAREMEKVEKVESELAIKASSCGPEPIRCWESSDSSSPGSSSARKSRKKEKKTSSTGEQGRVPLPPSPTTTTTATTKTPASLPTVAPRPVPRPRTRIPVSISHIHSLRQEQQQQQQQPKQQQQQQQQQQQRKQQQPKQQQQQQRPQQPAETPTRPSRKKDMLMMTQSCHEGLVYGSDKREPPPPPPVASNTWRKEDRPKVGPRLVTLAQAAGRRQGSGGSLRLRMTGSDETEEEEEEREREGSGSALSWFIPSEDVADEETKQVDRVASPGGLSLLEQYQVCGLTAIAHHIMQDVFFPLQTKKRKEEKALKSSAFFIEVEDDDDDDDGVGEEGGADGREAAVPFSPWASKQGGRDRRRVAGTRPRSGKVRTRVIDLEDQHQNEDEEGAAPASAPASAAPAVPDLQEALRTRRPDYIASTRDREASRLARRMLAAERRAVCRGRGGGGGNPDGIVEDILFDERQQRFYRSPQHRRRHHHHHHQLVSRHSTPAVVDRHSWGEGDVGAASQSPGRRRSGGRHRQQAVEAGSVLPDKANRVVPPQKLARSKSDKQDGQPGLARETTSTRAKASSRKYSGSPYGQSLSSGTGKTTGRGLPNVHLSCGGGGGGGGSGGGGGALGSNASKEVRKKKEGAGYRTNRTMSTSLAK